MQAPVYGLTGEVIEHIEISDQVFGVPFNQAVVHQAMVRQRATLVREQLALRPGVRLLVVDGSCFVRRAPVRLGLVA